MGEVQFPRILVAHLREQSLVNVHSMCDDSTCTSDAVATSLPSRTTLQVSIYGIGYHFVEASWFLAFTDQTS